MLSPGIFIIIFFLTFPYCGLLMVTTKRGLEEVVIASNEKTIKLLRRVKFSKSIQISRLSVVLHLCSLSGFFMHKLS